MADEIDQLEGRLSPYFLQTQKIVRESKSEPIDYERLAKAITVNVPEPKVNVTVPQPEITVSVPPINIPEIKLPEISIPPVVVPTPQVTVNVDEVTVKNWPEFPEPEFDDAGILKALKDLKIAVQQSSGSGGSHNSEYQSGSAYTAGKLFGTVPLWDDAGTLYAISATKPLPTAATLASGSAVNILNSDTTDNSLSTGGQIGQKSMIVGTIDLPVRGITAEGASLSQIQPVYAGTQGPTGNSKGLISDTTGNLHTNLAGSSITNSSANSYASSLAFGATRTGTIEDLGNKGFIWIAGMADSGGAGSPDCTFHIRYYDVLAGTNLIHTETFRLRSKNGWDAAWRVPAYSQYARVDIVNEHTSASITIKLNVRYTTVGDGGDTFEKNVVQVGGEQADTEIDAVGIKISAVDSTGVQRLPLEMTDNGSGIAGILSANVKSLSVGSSSSSLGKLEDSAHATGHLGVMGLSVRQTTPTDLSAGATNGDYEPTQVDETGRLYTTLGHPGVTLLASAARTTTQTSADLTNATGRGIVVIMDATTVTAGASLVVTIDAKDPASGKYYNLLTGAAITAVSTNVLRIYPEFTAAANIAKDFLPRTFRIVVTPADSKSVTYSVGYNLIP